MSGGVGGGCKPPYPDLQMIIYRNLGRRQRDGNHGLITDQIR